MNIFVNQIGYETNGTKYAYARGFCGNEVFELKSTDGTVVYSGKISAPIEDRVAGEPVCCIDFSELKTAGEYKLTLKVTGDGYVSSSAVCEEVSRTVKIGEKLYEDLYFSTLNYFYLSRCGEDIKGGIWSHPSCHTTPALIYGTDIKRDVTGGWHDAGDYGRYIVAGAKAVMDLLLSYEAVGSAYKKFDILAEVRFELEWMLQLQREDGGVFHKISCYHFCAFINPQDEKDEIVISPVSTTATADFAGVCAYAAGFYKTVDPAFAKKLVAVALKAQNYLDSHEDELFKNPPEITTGGYGDWSTLDERYFAAAALFAQTGEEKYVEKAMELRAQVENRPEDKEHPWMNHWLEGFGWGTVGGYGTEILLKNKNRISDKQIVAKLEKSMLERADKVLGIVNNASYGTSIEKVFWGSNGHVCDEAHALLVAYDLTGKKEYFEAAKKQIDYILGCNPMDVCYVTGFGEKTVEHPHHRPSGATGAVMPGMLAGGPCEGLNDAAAKAKLEPLHLPPLQCYLDEQPSYSTNEIAIYWNSTFVYIASKLNLV